VGNKGGKEGRGIGWGGREGMEKEGEGGEKGGGGDGRSGLF